MKPGQHEGLLLNEHAEVSRVCEFIGARKQAGGAARNRFKHSCKRDFPRCWLFWLLASAD
jgi:hypothetical protein